MIKLLRAFISTFLLLHALYTVSEAREMSKSGEIFKTAKDGVVTILTTTHGSGFLVDPSGLIITNSHVVNEAGENIKVRFGPGEVLIGEVLENDRNADVALVRVNLSNIKNYKVLELFNPPKDEPLVMVGEKVMAIGSPVKWETLEKTLTEGVVGKVEEDVIRHDASLNGGNSGGPLLNFDGQVVGINTFGDNERGPSIGGTISITKAIPLLEKAKIKLQTLPQLSDKMLPDAPRQPYPSEAFSRFDKLTNNEILRMQKLMIINSGNFIIKVSTPPSVYRSLKTEENLTLAERKKRATRKKFDIKDDELITKNAEFTKDWDYKKPVVTLSIYPKPVQTVGSAIAQGFVTGLVSYQAAMTIPSKFVYKKDFLRLSLRDPNNKTICQPYRTSRQPFTDNEIKSLGLGTAILIDKSYKGVYEFDAKCFNQPEPLKLVIETEGDKNNITISLKEALKHLITSDFNPYWEHVVKLEQQKETQAKIVTTPNPTDEKAFLEKIFKEAEDIVSKNADKHNDRPAGTGKTLLETPNAMSKEE